MTVITAHNLRRIIAQVRDHQADPEVWPHFGGIHLDATTPGHLHAVASDKYTLAVARAEAHSNRDLWAHTLPTAAVPVLLGWLQGMDGGAGVQVSPEIDGKTHLLFEADGGCLAFDTTGLDFPKWRAMLTGLLGKTAAGLVMGLDTGLLARWQRADTCVRAWPTGQKSPLVIAGHDFIGLQMTRLPDEATFQVDAIAAEWHTSLDGDVADGDGPALDAAAFEQSDQAAEEFAASLLRQVTACTDDLLADGSTVLSPEFYRTAEASISAWAAYRLLRALQTAQPVFAATTMRALLSELEGGDFAEWAWDYARKAGHDPEAWVATHRTWRVERLAEAAAPVPEEAAAVPA